MTYAADVDAIAAINRAIPGVNVAYGSADLPATLTVFPAAMTIVAPGDWSKMGMDEFVVRVYVAATGTGSPANAYRSCLLLLDAFRPVYTALGSINGRPLIRAPHGSGDAARGFGTSGFYYTQPWGGQHFYGFELFLPLGPRAAGA